jgi:hypothetical protein
MVLYVAYRAPIESKSRSALPNRLKQLGCQPVHRAFWKIEKKQVHKVLKVLENNQPIILKRLREIKNPQLAKKKAFTGLGSLIVVMFTLPKGANREKVKNFLRKAPCIRLRRSVYAFSQKQDVYDKDHKLVDARRFVDFIREMSGNVKIISRVVIMNKEAAQRLLQETHSHIEKETVEIVNRCKVLYKKACEGNDLGVLRDRFSRLKRRFYTLKKVSTFYAKWLKIDCSKGIMKAYHALRKVHHIIITE